LENLQRIGEEVAGIKADQESLLAEHQKMMGRITQLHKDIDSAIFQLREAEAFRLTPPPIPVEILEEPEPEPEPNPEPMMEEPKPEPVAAAVPNPQPEKKTEPKRTEKKAFDLEKFIGENLMSKIGILVILIGVAILGKYAIDNDLISPAARIWSGVALGAAFIGFAFKLRKSVENLSAVLMAGGTAIMYLMTYFAYSFYSLIPMAAAGAFMVTITAFTIWTAKWYNKELIAIYGQLCAYLVPFLIGGSNGNMLILITYIVVINVAITVVSAICNWQKAYLLSFVATWAVIGVSCGFSDDHFRLGYFVTLMIVHAATYYATLIWQKTRNMEAFKLLDVLLVITNALLCFSLSYYESWAAAGYSNGKLVVLIVNIVMHTAAAAYLYSRREKEMESLFYAVLACVAAVFCFAFIDCIDGSIKTIVVSMEMIAVYYLAIRSNSTVLKVVSWMLAKAVLVSVVYFWINDESAVRTLLSGLVVGMSYIYMARLHKRMSQGGSVAVEMLLWFVGMVVVYLGAALAIFRGCETKYLFYNEMSLLLVYVWAANFINTRYLKFKGIFDMLSSLATLTPYLVLLLVLVLESLGDNVILVYRYGIYLLIGLSMAHNGRDLKGGKSIYWFFTLTSVQAVSTFEIWDHTDSFKLNISIWWGLFSLGCIIYGLLRNSKLVRIYGIVLLGITLAKLFFADIAHLETIQKVIVFIVLGIIMLVGTYFYQKMSKKN